MQDIILTAVGAMATALGSKIGEDAYRAVKSYLADKWQLARTLKMFERQPESDDQQKWLAEDLQDIDIAADPEFAQLIKSLQEALANQGLTAQSALRIKANEGSFITLGDVDIQGSAGVDISKNKDSRITTGNIKVRS